MAKSIDIVVPDLGDFADVEIIEVLVKAGDRVALEDGLITVETDKASMDIPAPQDGVIDSLTVDVGGKVNSGDVIGKLSIDGADGDSTDSAAPDPGEKTDTVIIPPPGASSTAAEQTLIVPDLGDFADVEVIEVHIQAGSDSQRRRPAGHTGNRQGRDGRAVDGCRYHQGGAGQRWRQSVAGIGTCSSSMQRTSHRMRR